MGWLSRRKVGRILGINTMRFLKRENINKNLFKFLIRKLGNYFYSYKKIKYLSLYIYLCQKTDVQFNSAGIIWFSSKSPKIMYIFANYL